jgi:hypothetical protein
MRAGRPAGRPVAGLPVMLLLCLSADFEWGQLRPVAGLPVMLLLCLSADFEWGQLRTASARILKTENPNPKPARVSPLSRKPINYMTATGFTEPPVA